MIAAPFTKAASFITLIVAGKTELTGRRNTFDYILFEHLVESFGRSSPAEGFAGSCVQSMRYRAQLIDAVLAEIRALWEVLS